MEEDPVNPEIDIELPSNSTPTEIKKILKGPKDFAINLLAQFFGTEVIKTLRYGHLDLPDNKKGKLAVLYPEGIEADLEQSNNGDCYFLAALYSIKQSPLAPYIMSKLIRYVDKEAWYVDFLKAKGQVVKKDELNGQKIKKRNGKTVHRYSVGGQAGDKILERAFGRQRKLGRRKHEVDMGTMLAIEGGHGDEVYEDVLGDTIKCTTYGKYHYGSEWQNGDVEDLKREFRNIVECPTQYLVSASTAPVRKGAEYVEFMNEDGVKERHYYLDKDRFFLSKHAYAITNIDAERETLTVINPHNTKSKVKEISFDDFFKYFRRVYIARFNQKKVLEKFGDASGANMGINNIIKSWPGFEEYRTWCLEGIFDQPLRNKNDVLDGRIRIHPDYLREHGVSDAEVMEKTKTGGYPYRYNLQDGDSLLINLSKKSSPEISRVKIARVGNILKISVFSKISGQMEVKELKSLKIDQEVVIGRSDTPGNNRFTSNEHIWLKFGKDKEIYITNLDSTNGVIVQKW